MKVTRARLEWFWMFLLLVGAVLLGGLLATGAGLRLLALILPVLALPLAYWMTRSFTDRRGWLLPVVWGLMLVTTGIQHVSGLPVGYLMELLLFGLGITICLNFWKRVEEDRLLGLLLLLWLLHSGLGLLSTVLGRSQLMAAVWQLQYNLKWPLMFGLGLLVARGETGELRLRQLLSWSWVVLLACIVLEIAWPGGHEMLFDVPPDLHPNPILGFGLRYRGPFFHSGYLALSCALLVSACLALALAGRGRRWLWLALVYGGLALLSGQRQELFALAVCIAIFLLLAGRRHGYLFLLLGIFLGGIVLAGGMFLDQMPGEAVLAQWGLIEGTGTLSERAILSLNGVQVAERYFPLGSGWGTYGGVGAQKFDQSLFVELGFGRYWWFRRGLFLVDTYWPGVVAETGFAGAASLLLLFLLLWGGLFRRCLEALRQGQHVALCATGLAAATLLLLNSPTSAVLTDPRGALLFWLLIGAAWRIGGQLISGSPAFVQQRSQLVGKV